MLASFTFLVLSSNWSTCDILRRSRRRKARWAQAENPKESGSPLSHREGAARSTRRGRSLQESSSTQVKRWGGILFGGRVASMCKALGLGPQICITETKQNSGEHACLSHYFALLGVLLSCSLRNPPGWEALISSWESPKTIFGSLSSFFEEYTQPQGASCGARCQPITRPIWCLCSERAKGSKARVMLKTKQNPAPQPHL